MHTSLERSAPTQTHVDGRPITAEQRVALSAMTGSQRTVCALMGLDPVGYLERLREEPASRARIVALTQMQNNVNGLPLTRAQVAALSEMSPHQQKICGTIGADPIEFLKHLREER